MGALLLEVTIYGFIAIGIFAIPMTVGIINESKKKKQREELEEIALRKYINDHADKEMRQRYEDLYRGADK